LQQASGGNASRKVEAESKKPQIQAACFTLHTAQKIQVGAESFMLKSKIHKQLVLPVDFVI
jgi:hypothetical protein